MIDPAGLCLFIPPELSSFKRAFFARIGETVGRTVSSFSTLDEATAEGFTPIVGCTPALRSRILRYRAEGRRWVYWDRGYLGRYLGTAIHPGRGPAHYRCHVGCFQMERTQNRPGDRFARLGITPQPWRRGGRAIVVAAASDAYIALHNVSGWLDATVGTLRRYTDRPIRVRQKRDPRPLTADLLDAHALVTHGSIAAVEAAMLGVPVFVDRSSAAVHVGLTDLSKIEAPIYPERQPWLAALAYEQFSEDEMRAGACWEMMG